MQGPGKCKPLAAVELSTSDEASKLTLFLQKQLEDDIARIFDESIYPDLELVCGKLKILTNTCILKTRSNKFFQKLQTILQVNFDRSTFDEIYSFISDSYTECDIKRQEKEILHYLETNLNGPWSTKEPVEDELFFTPKCLSPYNNNKRNNPKSLSSSPSIELTKEYYALVPIEGNILDKELIEQDVLSNAFHTIIKNQKEEYTSNKKPTTLSLSSSHTPNVSKHSNSCDSLNRILDRDERIDKGNAKDNAIWKTFDVPDLLMKTNCEVLPKRNNDFNVSLDSSVADDPSSSSDYLSAVYTSPEIVNINFDFQSNVCTSKMENTFTSSDSGLGCTGMQESLNSNRDSTLIDISLTESTIHDTNESSLSQYTDNESSNVMRLIETLPSEFGTIENSSGNNVFRQKDTSCNTSKEEKQKQNEEIVILESSSLSSEAGSWESVFPLKQANRETRQKPVALNRDRIDFEGLDEASNDRSEYIAGSLVQKSPFKSTSCFIDAASLVDEVEDEIRIQTDTDEAIISVSKPDTLQLEPSKPVPCATIKETISPKDKSECNENDDSLEQTDTKDPDSIAKDLSPTIFEMTPITEDSLCSNPFETVVQDDIIRNGTESKSPKGQESRAIFFSNTPYNSIMSVGSNSKQYESESDTDTIKSSSISILQNRKKSECQPIVSGGASIEDHLPQQSSYSCSPAMRRKLESSPIVSGAYVSTEEDRNVIKSPKPTVKSAWVVDMSTNTKQNDIFVNASRRPGDKTCENLKNISKNGSNENCCKSRSSVDSDSSERSSHKFYIDLSSLPDSSPSSNNLDAEQNVEKKNIFSMYIDIGNSQCLKEMPSRLSSSLNCKKVTVADGKSAVKPVKTKKLSCPPKDTKIVNDTFETLEMLCSDPNISISEIISTEKTVSKILNTDIEMSSQITEKSNDTIILEKSIKDPIDLFVRLSDLDKPALKSDAILVATKDISHIRMTRSIPDDNWKDNQAITSRSIEIISSFHSENAQSLNRLFPHLKNEFSASMPGSLSSRTRSPLRLAVSSSPGEVEEIVSDVSEISSIQSSMCRSVVENSTTEDTSQTSSLISNCQSRLGQDLLRMFLQEIAPDVVVEVAGRKIKAHKCILSSRCQYFAGILSGGWVESSGNVIVLPPFSFNVVHFALCHIYSGVSTIPDSISIVELATIADMLGLEGLKEVIMFTLKAKYCHHFHKPCQVCTAGVLECFPLSSVYGLDDLYRKCLRWITKYFSKVWPTKAFATLPKELLDKCYQQHIVNLNVDNLVDTVFGCGLTVSSLHNSRWAESVARMCRRLVNATAHYAAPRLLCVLQNLAHVPATVPPPARQALDDCLAAAIEWAPPDEACRAYAFLSETHSRQLTDFSKPDLISNGHPPEPLDRDSLLYARAASWRQQCEGALVRAALRVVGTQAFKDLPTDLRKRLRELGCIMYGAHAIPASNSPIHDRKTRSPMVVNQYKNKNTLSLNMDIVRTSFVPYSIKPVKTGSVEIIKSSNDIRDAKKNKSQPPKIRMTKTQEERAKFNLFKTNQSQERNIKPHRQRSENAKPKYLEPRMYKDSEKKSPLKKLAPKMISSSESSRNSSPVQPRNMRTSRLKGHDDNFKVQAMSQDSLATSSRPWTAEPSTDSLSESQNSNKYATYTKSKHAVKGSVESVKTLKSQSVSSESSRLKTKIPVACSQNQRNLGKSVNVSQINKASGKSNVSGNLKANKQNERKIPASLMSATKSSSAKIVPRVVKDAASTKNKPVKSRQNKKLEETPLDIPIMERSGTFLKDEPTFGDKTVDIDK